MTGLVLYLIGSIFTNACACVLWEKDGKKLKFYEEITLIFLWPGFWGILIANTLIERDSANQEVKE